MRLYVKDKETNAKIFLNRIANTKQEFAKNIGTINININNKKFHVNEIKAESDTNNTVAKTMALGGVLGILGGVEGVFIGGLIGGLLGRDSEEKDKLKVKRFNNSKV